MLLFYVLHSAFVFYSMNNVIFPYDASLRQKFQYSRGHITLTRMMSSLSGHQIVLCFYVHLHSLG
jgi:hypothetical protein